MISDSDSDESEVKMDSATAAKLWIHCNSCYELYVKKRCALFLLACQHVTCEKCVTAHLGLTPGDAPTYTCPICKKRVRGRQVNNALPTNLKDLFHPEPWRDGLPHELIDSFQKANIKHFEAHIEKKENEATKLDKDMTLAQNVCQKTYMELKALRMSRKHLEFRVRKISYQVELRKQEKQRRLSASRKSVSPSTSAIAGKFSVPTSKNSRARSVSAGPIKNEPVSVSSNPETKRSITSFSHHNNHSFIL